MDATEVFCETMKGKTLIFARVDYIKDPSSFWLCEVKFCAKPMITASIRRSRDARVETVHVPVEDFSWISSAAFTRLLPSCRCSGTNRLFRVLNGGAFVLLVKLCSESVAGFLVWTLLTGDLCWCGCFFVKC